MKAVRWLNEAKKIGEVQEKLDQLREHKHKVFTELKKILHEDEVRKKRESESSMAAAVNAAQGGQQHQQQIQFAQHQQQQLQGVHPGQAVPQQQQYLAQGQRVVQGGQAQSQAQQLRQGAGQLGTAAGQFVAPMLGASAAAAAGATGSAVAAQQSRFAPTFRQAQPSGQSSGQQAPPSNLRLAGTPGRQLPAAQQNVGGGRMSAVVAAQTINPSTAMGLKTGTIPGSATGAPPQLQSSITRGSPMVQKRGRSPTPPHSRVAAVSAAHYQAKQSVGGISGASGSGSQASPVSGRLGQMSAGASVYHQKSAYQHKSYQSGSSPARSPYQASPRSSPASSGQSAFSSYGASPYGQSSVPPPRGKKGPEVQGGAQPGGLGLLQQKGVGQGQGQALPQQQATSGAFRFPALQQLPQSAAGEATSSGQYVPPLKKANVSHMRGSITAGYPVVTQHQAQGGQFAQRGSYGILRPGTQSYGGQRQSRYY